MLVSIITTRIMVLYKDPMRYIYIYTRNSFQLDSVSERDASKKETLNKHIFQDWECANFFDIQGCLNSIGQQIQLFFHDSAPAGDCRKCL